MWARQAVAAQPRRLTAGALRARGRRPSPCCAATSTFSNTVISVNGRGTWYVRPMPSRHRAAASSLVTGRPPKEIAPAPGDRSPEMRPNRLVLPAPFGPTIPTVSPDPTVNERSSAMTTRPNLFVTWSSSSRELVIRFLVRRFEGSCGRHVRHQRIVHDLHRVTPLGAGLPLHAHTGGVHHAGRRVLLRGPVELTGQ